MLEKLISVALRNRLVVVLCFLVAFAAGTWSLVQLPVDAFPDTTPVQVQINTTAPSLGPEEIEKQISLPVELSISGLPGLVHVRSISKFGLSQVVAIFEDEMAILDSRLNTKRYGPRVVASLPRARRTLRFEDVVAFFSDLKQG